MTPGADRHWAQVQEEPCEECGFDPLGTDPADLPGAVRGLSRRFRAPLTRFLPGEDPSVIVRARPEPTTWSALEYTCHTRGALALFDRRIRLALEEDDPVLEWWDHEAAAVDEAYNAEDPVAAADGLAAAAEGLAATLASVPPDAWDRTARRGEDRFTVVGMGRYALHEGHHHLLDVGRVLRAARPLMAGLDVSRVAPSDAAVTMRSLPRRFRSLFATPADDPGEGAEDDLAHRVGPEGRSAADHLAVVVRSLALLERALDQVLIHDRPVLHPAVVDEAARTWEAGEQVVGGLLAELAERSQALAARIERTPAGDWSRRGAVAGDGEVSALDLVREAVRTAVDHLHAAERVLAVVRGA